MTEHAPITLTAGAHATACAEGATLLEQLLKAAPGLSEKLDALDKSAKEAYKKQAKREAADAATAHENARAKAEKAMKDAQDAQKKVIDAQKRAAKLHADVLKLQADAEKLRVLAQQKRELTDASPTSSALVGPASSASSDHDDDAAERSRLLKRPKQTRGSTFRPIPEKADSKCGLVFHLDLAKWHKPVEALKHKEVPDRIVQIYYELSSTGALAACRHPAPRRLDSAADSALLRQVHTEEHVSSIGMQKYEELEGAEKEDMFAVDDTPQAARLAAGCCVVAVESVMRGDVLTAFSIVRPPGHHAHRDKPSGYCWLNNVAIAARAALKEGAKKVAIVDWDVHHGDGTQDIFLDDPAVLYMSLHRFKTDKLGFFFPGTGSAADVGTGKGAGCTVNVPFTDLGMAGVDYMAAFEHVLLPILNDFKPDIILISAGFDAAEAAFGMNLTAETYAAMTKALMQVRSLHAVGGPRVVSCLEGGYDVQMTAKCADAMVRTQLYFVGGTCSEGEPASTVTGMVARTTPSVLKAVRDAHRAYWPAINATEGAFNAWCARI